MSKTNQLPDRCPDCDRDLQITKVKFHWRSVSMILTCPNCQGAVVHCLSQPVPTIDTSHP
jgi:hypothetical protein